MVFLCDKNNKRWDSSEIEWATARAMVRMGNFMLVILSQTKKNSKYWKKSKIARLILLVLYEWTVEMLVKFQVNCLESFTTYNSSQTLVTDNYHSTYICVKDLINIIIINYIIIFWRLLIIQIEIIFAQWRLHQETEILWIKEDQPLTLEQIEYSNFLTLNVANLGVTSNCQVKSKLNKI